jgi:hypothetical protein
LTRAAIRDEIEAGVKKEVAVAILFVSPKYQNNQQHYME